MSNKEKLSEIFQEILEQVDWESPEDSREGLENKYSNNLYEDFRYRYHKHLYQAVIAILELRAGEIWAEKLEDLPAVLGYIKNGGEDGISFVDLEAEFELNRDASECIVLALIARGCLSQARFPAPLVAASSQ